MNTKLICMTTVISAATLWGFSDAQSQDVKQLGAKPDSDQLIQSLIPPSGAMQGMQGRGLQVLSGKHPANDGSSRPSDRTAADNRASAVALDVHFDIGSDKLTDAARDTVDRIAKALNSSQLSGYRFLIEGHTDSTGHPNSNLALSQRRAEAVKAYLVANDGTQADRLETAGKGSSEPLDAAHPTSGVNRRVQIVNLGQ